MRATRHAGFLALLLGPLFLACGCHGLFIRPAFVAETRVETAAYSVRTDLSSEAREVLVRTAERMRGELEAALPAPEGADPEPRREIVAFAVQKDFQHFLGAHVFSQERAIGFYCELGRECAVAWQDPPGPEDVRVLRHELSHQHLAARLRGHLPAWLEEGLVERLALGLGLGDGRDPEALPVAMKTVAVAASVGHDRFWGAYRARRFAADAYFAGSDVSGGRRSWPDRPDRPASAVPPPSWAGDGRYVLHFSFIRFLESIGEGSTGALGECIAAAAAGKDADLDLSRRFSSLRELESAFHAWLVSEARSALTIDPHGEEEAALRKVGG